MTNGANAALAAWFGAQNCYLDMAAMRPARRLVRRAATCRNADSPRTVAMTILPTQGLVAGSVQLTVKVASPR